MGGICSKRATVDNVPSSSYSQNGCGNHGTALLNSHALPGKEHSSSTPLNGREDEDKQIREPFSFPELDSNTDGIVENSNGTYTDAIDDGIPRFSRVLSHKSRSTKSKQVAVAKVSEVSSLLGKAGSAGFGKAVEVLDNLGSSMTSLHLSGGFVSGVTTKGNKIAILAYEVANTIVKGANLMQSLSKESIKHLKEVVLRSEGVQSLISKDIDELQRIAAADKRFEQDYKRKLQEEDNPNTAQRDISTKDAQDDAFRDDFLANVTRIIATPKLEFGHGSVAHGRDSRYWDGDDRRRDEDYNEDVHKSTADNDDEPGKGHGSSRVKSPAKKNKNPLTKSTDHHGLYNEAGRNELKMYEEKYEASLKNVGQAGVETEDGNHVLDGGNSDVDNEDVDADDEYDDGIDSHDSHVDEYDDNKHEIETISKLPKSHSEHIGFDSGKGHDTVGDYDSSKDSSAKLQSGKTKQSTVADVRSNTNSGKQPKKHRKHRKFSSSSCDMKLLNSTAQLVEPLESRKFARFSLSFTEREEKPDGIDYWEPRFAGHQSLREREDSFLARDQKINCGFVKGPKEYSSTGFDLAEDDYRYISKCHIAVVSCIFGNSDRLRSPFVKVISRLSRKNVCFVMFMDEKTLRTITLEGQIPDRMGFIGLWKIVVVKNLPFSDMRRVGKIPKLLSHRLFPSARYSIWLDSKLRLQRDPLLLLEHFLWRKGHEYAISNHYDRHCVWEEVERNKKLNKFNHTMIDQQFQFYQADGLKRFNASDPGKLLPSNVPEGSLIIRAHTPMSNLFSCLWFNEVDRFTPRDQLSFAYTYQKLKKKNPSKTFYLYMFKDCERRQIAKLFHHRSDEKRNSLQDATE